MKTVAIITGASSGLGSEFARQIDALREVNQIWLIARRRERLEEVAAQLDAQTRVLCADLSTREGISVVAKTLAEANETAAASGEGGIFVRYLVVAAGFGKIGSYRDIPLEEVDRMIDLNCRGAVDMTQITLPYCARGSHILEICSTAGFQPFQYLNVYAASKSFLYRYSRALNMELLREGSGITVTAVCPYWVTDTEFIPGAESTAGRAADVTAKSDADRAADNAKAGEKGSTVRQNAASVDKQVQAGPEMPNAEKTGKQVRTDSVDQISGQEKSQQTHPEKPDALQEGSHVQKSPARPGDSKDKQPSYGNRFIRHYPLSTRKESVVAHALADASLGLSVSTPGLVCTIHRFFAKILSSNVLMWCWELIRRA